jgi:hypothetical protein
MAGGERKSTTIQADRRAGPPRYPGVLAGVVLLCGLYLMIAPWVAGFGSAANLAVSDTVAGFALALLAVAHALFAARMQGISWVLPVIGAWIVVSPWVIDRGPDMGLTATARTGNAIAGVLVVLAGGAFAAPAFRRSR